MSDQAPKQNKPGYPRPGAGRIKGKSYPHLQQFCGQWEQRLAWLRMRAQAKHRSVDFNLAWEDFLSLWEGRWHLRGSVKGSLALIRKDWELGWSKDNVELATREEIMRRQGRARVGKKYAKKPKV